MTEHEIRRLASQFIDALHTLEQGTAESTNVLAGLFHPDAQLTNAALKLLGEERQGNDRIREFWMQYRRSFNEIFSEFHQITTNEEAAGLFWTSKGIDIQGQPFDYDGVSLLVFNPDGKILRFHGYYDTRQLTRSVEAR